MTENKVAKDLTFIQDAILLATEDNDYSGMNSQKFRGALTRLCKVSEESEEREAKLYGLPYVKHEGSHFCSVDNKEKINIRLHQIVYRPLTLATGVWLLDCVKNGMFIGMNNDDYNRN